MLFIQDGKVIEVPGPKLEGLDHFDNTITPEYCAAYPPLFEDRDRHNEVGGTPALNEALRLPMVLVLSIWADVSSSILHSPFLQFGP